MACLRANTPDPKRIVLLFQIPSPFIVVVVFFNFTTFFIFFLENKAILEPLFELNASLLI